MGEGDVALESMNELEFLMHSSKIFLIEATLPTAENPDWVSVALG
jgi:hypothetical protein